MSVSFMKTKLRSLDGNKQILSHWLKVSRGGRARNPHAIPPSSPPGWLVWVCTSSLQSLRAQSCQSVRAITVLRTRCGKRESVFRWLCFQVTDVSPESYSWHRWRGRPSCPQRSSLPVWTVRCQGQRAARCRSLTLSLTKQRENKWRRWNNSKWIC